MAEPPRPIRPKNAPPPRAVREVVQEARTRPGSTAPSVPEADRTRTLEVNGRRWRIDLLGTGRTGNRGDAGAPLLLLRFTADAPPGGDVPTSGPTPSAGGGAPAPREGWAVGFRLSEVPESALEDLLRRARVVKP